MDTKLQEDVQITVKDSASSRLKSSNYVVNIDEKGNGTVETEELNGYLECLIIPPHLTLFGMSIKSVSFPEWEIFNLKREDDSLRILPIQMQCYDSNGHIIQDMAKIPLLGKYNILITSAVPNSQLDVKLIWGN